jgi:hypothetical protein
MIRSNFTNLMKVDLDNVLQEAWKGVSYEDLLAAIFNVSSSTKREEISLTVGGFPMLVVKDEGEDLAQRSFQEGYKTTYTHKTFGIYASLSMEAQDDEQYGTFKKIPWSMARSVDATLNYYMSRIFTRCTDASEDFITGGDGQALLSTAHPLTGGGTSSNKPSTDADLSATTLHSAINAFYEMLDDAGKPLLIAP